MAFQTIFWKENMSRKYTNPVELNNSKIEITFLLGNQMPDFHNSIYNFKLGQPDLQQENWNFIIKWHQETANPTKRNSKIFLKVLQWMLRNLLLEVTIEKKNILSVEGQAKFVP